MKKEINKIIFILFIPLFLLSCNRDGEILSPGNTSYECKWSVISWAGKKINNIFFADKLNGWVAGDSGTIRYSSDGGLTWSDQTSNTTSSLTSVFFLTPKKGLITGYNGTLLYTMNGGEKWEKLSVPNNSTSILSSVHMDNKEHYWCISNTGEVFYSNYLGREWNYMCSFNASGYTYLNFLNENVGFAAQILGNTIQKTTDGGNTWTTIKLAPQWTYDIFFLNENFGWYSECWSPSSTVHDTTLIYSTTDGGVNWNKCAAFTGRGVILRNIKFLDENNGWLSAVTDIHNTTDGGKTWNIKYQLADHGYIMDMFFLNNHIGWALASDGSILKYYP